jgi:hypothetical protein
MMMRHSALLVLLALASLLAPTPAWAARLAWEAAPFPQTAIFTRGPTAVTYTLLKRVHQDVTSLALPASGAKRCYQVRTVVFDPTLRRITAASELATVKGHPECTALCVSSRRDPLAAGECYP